MKKKTKEEITLFTFLKQLLSKERKVPYDKKIAPAFMLSMGLSHDQNLLQKVNEINKYQFMLPDEAVYNYYMSVIPAGKRYIPWIKKRKEDEKTQKRIDKLKELYPNLSTRECKMIISFLQLKKGE
jgi:hypothetical protein